MTKELENKSTEELRVIYRDTYSFQIEFLRQHYPRNIKKYLNGVFNFTDVKFGNIKKGEGDVVLVNCSIDESLKEFITLDEYLKYTLAIKKIEKKGIYTNIYFTDEFFINSLKLTQ